MFNAKILISNTKTDLQQGHRLIQENLGTPQGNILSPLLCNIYLHELDMFMEKTIEKYKKGTQATRNPEYYQMTLPTEAEWRLPDHVRRNRVRARRKMAREKKIKPTILDDNFTRVKYVRYADDFIVGVRGPKELTIKIKKEVEFFIKSSLHLEINQEKTKTTNTYHEKAKFLGMLISNVPAGKQPFRKAGHIEKAKRNRTRVINRIKRKNDQQFKNTRETLLNNLKKESKVAQDSGTAAK